MDYQKLLTDLVLIGAAVGVLIGGFRAFTKLFRSWFKFMDDWYGTNDWPGIMARLEDGNKRFDALEQDVKVIKAELFNNHGTSLRDAIDRIEKAVSNNETKDEL